MIPTKNVELTNWSSKRWADNNDFIGPSVFGVQYAKESWPYLSFEYIPGS